MSQDTFQKSIKGEDMLICFICTFFLKAKDRIFIHKLQCSEFLFLTVINLCPKLINLSELFFGHSVVQSTTEKDKIVLCSLLFSVNNLKE